MAERFIAFEVFGCFEVPVDASAGQRFVDHQRLRDFWKHARLGGLADERGCYVFALRTGRGIKPLYVGKATKGFAKECFQERNQLNLARGLRGKRGTLVLFLVKYVHKGRGRTNRTAIDALEKQVIDLAYGRNPDLLNIHGARRKWRLRIKGVLNPEAGKPSKSETEFKKMLGLKS